MGALAGAGRADRVARGGDHDGIAVFHRGVLRHRHASRVVGRAPDARTAGHRRGDLRGVRPRVARRPGRRPPHVASAPAGVGRRRGPAARACACCSSSRSDLSRPPRSGRWRCSSRSPTPRSSSKAPPDGCPSSPNSAACCPGVLMMTWWTQAAGSVGVLPSLLVVVGLTLVTLVGHAWSVRSVDGEGAVGQAPFARGLYLGLIGHLFLLFLATDRTWSLPPWPVFAALAAITLATSAAALWSRVATMHAAGTIAAAAVVTAWSAGRGSARVGTHGGAGRRSGQRLRALVATAGRPLPRGSAGCLGGRRGDLRRGAVAHRCR